MAIRISSRMKLRLRWAAVFGTAGSYLVYAYFRWAALGTFLNVALLPAVSAYANPLLSPKLSRTWRVRFFVLMLVAANGVAYLHTLGTRRTQEAQFLSTEAQLYRERAFVRPGMTAREIVKAEMAFREKADRLLAGASTAASSRDAGEDAAAYLNLSQVIGRLRPAYEHVMRLDKLGQHQDAIEALRRLGVAFQREYDGKKLAGYFNHLASLQMGSGDGEGAFVSALNALRVDPQHVPAYETLGYIQWAFFENPRKGLEYASAGLASCTRFVGSPTREMEVRFKIQIAYFNALLREHRDIALRYAEEAARPSAPEEPLDPDALDTLGFVRLRFAKTESDVESALSDFARACDRAQDTSLCLACAHYQEALRTLGRMRSQ